MPRCEVSWCRARFVTDSLLEDHMWSEHLDVMNDSQ